MSEIIRVEGLKKYFKDVKAVDDISFCVERGELFGFLGVNGAGKSTTINMLCTLSKPDGGTVRICNLELGRENDEIKRRIGVVYQNNCLDKRLTVRENLLLRGALYEPEKKKLRHNLGEVCEILELGDVIRRPYGKLSGGQKRRCEIARALMHKPEILFLDEPTAGLDPGARKSMWRTIQSLRSEGNMTVFLTTHYMEEAAWANHIAIIDSGRLVQYGTPFELKEKFARDKLRLIPKSGQRERLLEFLKRRDIMFRLREEYISIPLEQTMAALPIVEEVSVFLEGFEVIQGTMDDVFLNATGGQKNYA